MSAAEQIGSVIEPANLNDWSDQQKLSDAIGDGLAYYIQQNDDIHKSIMRAYESGDMDLLGKQVAIVINHQFEEWK